MKVDFLILLAALFAKEVLPQVVLEKLTQKQQFLKAHPQKQPLWWQNNPEGSANDASPVRKRTNTKQGEANGASPVRKKTKTKQGDANGASPARKKTKTKQ